MYISQITQVMDEKMLDSYTNHDNILILNKKNLAMEFDLTLLDTSKNLTMTHVLLMNHGGGAAVQCKIRYK